VIRSMSPTLYIESDREYTSKVYHIYLKEIDYQKRNLLLRYI